MSDKYPTIQLSSPLPAGQSPRVGDGRPRSASQDSFITVNQGATFHPQAAPGKGPIIRNLHSGRSSCFTHDLPLDQRTKKLGKELWPVVAAIALIAASVTTVSSVSAQEGGNVEEIVKGPDGHTTEINGYKCIRPDHGSPRWSSLPRSAVCGCTRSLPGHCLCAGYGYTPSPCPSSTDHSDLR